MPPILTIQEQFSRILNRRHATKEDVESSLNELRWLVLAHPCPTEVCFMLIIIKEPVLIANI